MRCRPDEIIFPYPPGAEINSTPHAHLSWKILTSMTISEHGSSADMQIYWLRFVLRVFPSPAPTTRRVASHPAIATERKCAGKPWRRSLPINYAHGGNG